MHWYRSSLGKKYVMAATGLMLAGYVAVHMLGNLSIYAGASAINSYAEKLHALPAFLWAFRFALAAAALLHILTGVILYLQNRKARPVDYCRKKNVRTSFPAETMIWTGSALLLFVVYHVLHLTLRVTDPTVSHLVDAIGRPDVFAMIIVSFRKAAVTAGYVAAMIVLLLHLYHGIQSMFQSVGLNDEQAMPVIDMAGRFAAFTIALGFISIPAAILAGLLSF
jgi:succinate dehydrogenase / fumarate reductase cytochrome b subunit